MELNDLLTVFCSLPAIVVLYFINTAEDKKYKVELWILLISYLVMDILTYGLAQKRINNLPFFHLMTILEFVLLARIFTRNYSERKAQLMKIVSAGVCVFLVFNSIFLENIFEFNSNAKIIAGIALIVFALLWYVDVFGNMRYDRIFQDPVFFLATGVFVYFTGNLYLFGMSKNLIKSIPEVHRNLWDIHTVLNVFLNLMLAIMAWQMRNPAQFDKSHQKKSASDSSFFQDVSN